MTKAFNFSDARSAIPYFRRLLSESVTNEGSRIYFHADGYEFSSHNTDKSIYFVRYMLGSTRFYQEFSSHDELIFEVKGPGYFAASNQVDVASYLFLCKLFGVSFSINNLLEKKVLFFDCDRVKFEAVFEQFDFNPVAYICKLPNLSVLLEDPNGCANEIMVI